MPKSIQKIMVITDDLKNINAHFWRSQYFLIFTVVNGKITKQEVREQHSKHSEIKSSPDGQPNRQASTMASIIECDVLLAGGLRQKTYDTLILRSIQPIITDIRDIQTAVHAYLSGTIINHLDHLR